MSEQEALFLLALRRLGSDDIEAIYQQAEENVPMPEDLRARWQAALRSVEYDALPHGGSALSLLRYEGLIESRRMALLSAARRRRWGG